MSLTLKQRLRIATDKAMPSDVRIYHALEVVRELEQKFRPAACTCHDHFPAEAALGYRCPACKDQDA